MNIDPVERIHRRSRKSIPMPEEGIKKSSNWEILINNQTCLLLLRNIKRITWMMMKYMTMISAIFQKLKSRIKLVIMRVNT